MVIMALAMAFRLCLLAEQRHRDRGRIKSETPKLFHRFALSGVDGIRVHFSGLSRLQFSVFF